ncbi:MAG: glycosyltransferase, partial [Spirochaetes bacterium]|nr:glycosyltransferase [Spirochaetota bacterium]
SILKYTKKIRYEIIVVDDQSHDGTVSELEKRYKKKKEIIIYKNSSNQGFARTNNKGIIHAKGEFVLILNADTLVTDNVICEFARYLKAHTDIGALGCKIVYPDGKIQYSCARMRPDFWTNLFEQFYLCNIFYKSRLFGKELISYWDHNSVRDIEVLSGAFMFIRSDLLRKTRGFDPYFRSYFEDVDLCLKILNKGYRIRYIPEYRIIHYSGKSFGPLKERSLIENYISRYKFLNRYYNSSFLLLHIVALIGLSLKFFFLLPGFLIKPSKIIKNRLIVFSRTFLWHGRNMLHPGKVVEM